MEAAFDYSDAAAFRTLRKTWQPVARSFDLANDAIRSVVLLGEDLVVARLPGGLLAARDQCPHRGAKFGLGQIVHGHLQCPYHGWEFAASGACVKIPSLIDATHKPSHACLTTFAVQERYGLVWVRLDAEEMLPLPLVPEFENAAWTYVVPPPMAFGCGFRREIENYLDMSHFAFAHKETLGVAAAGEITRITITHYDDGFCMDAPFPTLDNPERKPGKLQMSHHRRQRIFLPNFTTIRQSFPDGDERVLLHVPLPHTPTTCTVFWALAVSPGFDGPPAENQISFATRVLDEDRVMVENQRPFEVPLTREEDVVLVPADRLSNTYKNAFRELVFNDHNPRPAVGVEGAASIDRPPVRVLFGSQTGNAENLANRLARTLRAAGYEADAVSLAAGSPGDVSGVTLVVTSTYGNGNPPDNAVAFGDALDADLTADLSSVRYGVFALGDSKYAHFCQFGRHVDERFARLGATRLLSRVDCDRDYENAFVAWSEDVQRSLGRGAGQEVVALIEDAAAPGHSPTRPLPARVTENRRLSKLDSEKETRHYEVDLSGSGVTYEPGDALGVIPENDPDVVEAVIGLLDGDKGQTLADGMTLRRALAEQVELRWTTAPLRQALGINEPSDHDVADVYDLLRRAGKMRLEAAAFVKLAGALQPRLYSIASSPMACPGAAHLCVATVRYRKGTRSYKGVASTFLADRVTRHRTVPVFVRANPRFRLPADGDRPIIMIGPGTGVAPFRGFLQHRAAANAKGANWLFFGDQRSECDYLYQGELEAARRDGLLTRLDTAFSRDQTERVYVQHLLLQNAAEVWQWVNARDAAVYVCGDARRMARDVDRTLHEIVAAEGGLIAERAADYVQALQAEGRYQRDIY